MYIMVLSYLLSSGEYNRLWLYGPVHYQHIAAHVQRIVLFTRRPPFRFIEKGRHMLKY